MGVLCDKKNTVEGERKVLYKTIMKLAIVSDRIRNEQIKRILEGTNVVEEMEKNRSKQFGRVERKSNDEVLKST